MRKQYTIMALMYAAQMFKIGNVKIAAGVESTANKSMGNSPYFMPTKSQRVKNKLNRKCYGK